MGCAMKNKGFTLIELMVVVLVVGILAAIAYPSYQKSIQKSRRADARAAIADIQLAQEKRRGNCIFYAQTIGAADVCDAVNMGANNIVAGSATSNEGFYNMSILAATGNAYTIQADPQGVQAADTDCDPITFAVSAANPNGLKGPAGCW